MPMRSEARSSAASCEMDQSQPRLNEKEKEKSLTLTVNILVQKQGTMKLVLWSNSDACCCRSEIVRWVSESLRPFDIVKDRGFQSLMKTGRPEYYLPSPSTVSRDVRLIYARTRKHVAKMLRVSLSSMIKYAGINQNIPGI